MIEIVDMPGGERVTFTASRAPLGLEVTVAIDREHGRTEPLELRAAPGSPRRYASDAAPEEPHAFSAKLILRDGGRSDAVPFSVVEPEGHHPH